MVKTKELVICLSLIFCLALVFAGNVFALDSDPLDLETDWDAEDENVENIEDEGVENIEDEDNDIANDIANEEKPKNTIDKMPDTGIDYSVLTIIAVTGISAIYAYKKIRDYNV